MIMYSEREMDVVPGEAASTLGMRVDLMYVGGGRLITYNPWTGAVNSEHFNCAIDDRHLLCFLRLALLLTVQTLGTSANTQYRLINWTIAGDTSRVHSMGISDLA